MAPDFRPVTSAAEFAAEIQHRTASFPPEERYVEVQMLRDGALTVLENIALGMARYHPTDRFRLLMRAQHGLEEVHSRLLVCRKFGLLSPSEDQSLEEKHLELREYLMEAIETLKGMLLDFA